jgi:hypothetical protein
MASAVRRSATPCGTRTSSIISAASAAAVPIFDPMKAAALLNFTFDPRRGGYVSDDPERLPQRITNIVQMETRREILLRTLEETIRDSQAIASAAVARIREENLLQPIGVELINLYFLSAKPTPEVAKALEAPYRETMLRAADGAIYARRAATASRRTTWPSTAARLPPFASPKNASTS